MSLAKEAIVQAIYRCDGCGTRQIMGNGNMPSGWHGPEGSDGPHLCPRCEPVTAILREPWRVQLLPSAVEHSMHGLAEIISDSGVNVGRSWSFRRSMARWLAEHICELHNASLAKPKKGRTKVRRRAASVRQEGR